MVFPILLDLKCTASEAETVIFSEKVREPYIFKILPMLKVGLLFTSVQSIDLQSAKVASIVTL